MASFFTWASLAMVAPAPPWSLWRVFPHHARMVVVLRYQEGGLHSRQVVGRAYLMVAGIIEAMARDVEHFSLGHILVERVDGEVAHYFQRSFLHHIVDVESCAEGVHPRY